MITLLMRSKYGSLAALANAGNFLLELRMLLQKSLLADTPVFFNFCRCVRIASLSLDDKNLTIIGRAFLAA